MTIYIAGKMNGLPNKGRDAFWEAQITLEEQGHIVLNPAVLPDGLRPEQYLPICLAMLEQADAIYMLRNFENSPGALIEWRYAKYQGKQVILEGLQ